MDKLRTPVGDFLAVLRAEIQPITPLQRLIVQHPNLESIVQSVGHPLWFVLDRLDEAFEVQDRWAAAPSIQDAKSNTAQILTDMEDRHGLVALSEIRHATGDRMEDVDIRDWVKYCGFEVIGSHVLTRTSNIADRAISLLSLAGRPLQGDDLLAGIPDRSPTSVRNALGTDTRISRVNSDQWALTEWGQENYTSIKNLIARRLERSPGGVRINDLVEELTNSFTLTETSIRAYASAPPFMTHQGIVTFSTSGASGSVKPPSQTRRLYRNGCEWIYRFTVTEDHLRGSGFPIPRGVADALGCKPGRVVPFQGDHGPVTFRWTGLQPTCGSVREYLLALRATPGATALIRIDTGRTTAELELPGSPELGRLGTKEILKLMGRSADAGFTTTELCNALSLPAKCDALTIVQTLLDRGETDMFDLVTAHMSSLAGPDSPPGEPRPEKQEKNDLMELLGLWP